MIEPGQVWRQAPDRPLGNATQTGKDYWRSVLRFSSYLHQEFPVLRNRTRIGNELAD